MWFCVDNYHTINFVAKFNWGLWIQIEMRMQGVKSNRFEFLKYGRRVITSYNSNVVSLSSLMKNWSTYQLIIQGKFTRH